MCDKKNIVKFFENNSILFFIQFFIASDLSVKTKHTIGINFDINFYVILIPKCVATIFTISYKFKIICYNSLETQLIYFYIMQFYENDRL